MDTSPSSSVDPSGFTMCQQNSATTSHSLSQIFDSLRSDFSLSNSWSEKSDKEIFGTNIGNVRNVTNGAFPIPGNFLSGEVNDNRHLEHSRLETSDTDMDVNMEPLPLEASTMEINFDQPAPNQRNSPDPESFEQAINELLRLL